MAAPLHEVDSPDLILPMGSDDVVPDVELIELLETPTALAYILSDDPLKTEWEHQFSCGDARMYAGSENGRGVVVITGSFDVSPLTGFDDTCETKDI